MHTRWTVFFSLSSVLPSHLVLVTNSIANTENPQFVKVLVANKKRFTALRDLTVEGAQAELERQAIERKDRGDTSRGSSIDSMRRPAPLRTSSLAEVPEDSQFTIGDDDDNDDNHDDNHEDNEEEETDAEVSEKSTADSSQGTCSATDNTIAASPARLSDKARGKQPAAALRVSTSRNPSLTSLSTLTPVTTSQTFLPSEQWLANWSTQLPLDAILNVIEEAEKSPLGFTPITAPRQEHHANLSTTAPETQPSSRREARQSAQFTRHSAESSRSSQAAHGTDGQGHLSSKGKHNVTHSSSAPALNMTTDTSTIEDIRPAAGGPVNFSWTAVAIGWYNALIWSRIYVQEAEAFQGSGGLYSSTDIRLFRRQGASQEISLRSPKGAIDAVGLSLANRISSINLPDAFGGGGHGK